MRALAKAVPDVATDLGRLVAQLARRFGLPSMGDSSNREAFYGGLPSQVAYVAASGNRTELAEVVATGPTLRSERRGHRGMNLALAWDLSGAGAQADRDAYFARFRILSAREGQQWVRELAPSVWAVFRPRKK